MSEERRLDYSEAIDLLLGMVDHERPRPSAPRQKRIYDLGRMEALLDRLGQPQLATDTIHVAGTKGKGSVSALCDSVLHAAGYRTGFYSSPHLHWFRERIRRDTEPIDEDKFASLVERLWPHQQWVEKHTDLDAVSLFEFMTAMAFQCFAEDETDVQTIEVGLGGRLDATNVVQPKVCVITSISLDHTAILGDTIGEIASEKAGIVKPGVSVVVAPQTPEAHSVIIKTCRDRRASVVQVGLDVTWRSGASSLEGQRLQVKGQLGDYDLHVPLLGAHQLENAAAAVGALEELRRQDYDISPESMAEGFSRVAWPCRMEVLSRNPLVVADGAHNSYSMETLLESLPRYLPHRRLLLVVGFSRDKSVSQMVEKLAAVRPVAFVTRSRHPRSVPPSVLAAEFESRGVAAVETGSVAEAVEQAIRRARPGDLILGTGSLFVAAEVREQMLGIEPEVYPDLLPPDLRASGAGI
jgi:dihydrofolate synthase/folylpolyglutamate synthase